MQLDRFLPINFVEQHQSALSLLNKYFEKITILQSDELHQLEEFFNAPCDEIIRNLSKKYEEDELEKAEDTSDKSLLKMSL